VSNGKQLKKSKSIGLIRKNTQRLENVKAERFSTWESQSCISIWGSQSCTASERVKTELLSNKTGYMIVVLRSLRKSRLSTIVLKEDSIWGSQNCIQCARYVVRNLKEVTAIYMGWYRISDKSWLYHICLWVIVYVYMLVNILLMLCGLLWWGSHEPKTWYETNRDYMLISIWMYMMCTQSLWESYLNLDYARVRGRILIIIYSSGMWEKCSYRKVGMLRATTAS